MGNATWAPPLSVDVSGAWTLGGRVELVAAQSATWERPFGLTWLEVQNMSVAASHEASGVWSVSADGWAAVRCGSLELRVGASVTVGGGNGSAAWSLRPTELPPVSVFPPFALCVVRSAAAASGARSELLTALGQLEAAVLVDGEAVAPEGRRRELSALTEMGWGIGDMESVARASGSPIAPQTLLSGRSGLYVEAAGLLAG